MLFNQSKPARVPLSFGEGSGVRSFTESGFAVAFFFCLEQKKQKFKAELLTLRIEV